MLPPWLLLLRSALASPLPSTAVGTGTGQAAAQNPTRYQHWLIFHICTKRACLQFHHFSGALHQQRTAAALGRGSYHSASPAPHLYVCDACEPGLYKSYCQYSNKNCPVLSPLMCPALHEVHDRCDLSDHGHSPIRTSKG